MATVTGYTAQRMKQIEDSAIVDGEVVGDDLILIRYDEQTINAGSVRGPQGIQGPPGDVSEAPVDGVTYARKDGVWVPASVKTAKQTISSGDITPSINTWSALSTAHDLVLPAAAGDEVGLEILGRWDGTSQAGALTFFTRVANANVNAISGATDYGVISWCVDGSNTNPISFGGEFLYTVQANDIENGLITFRAHGKSIGAARTLNADATFPLRLQAKNYRQ